MRRTASTSCRRPAIRRSPNAGTARGDFDRRGICRGSDRMRAPAAADLLATIVAATRRIVEVRWEREPIAALEKRAEVMAAAAGRFLSAVSRTDRVNVIAECK